ncbi:MAG: hypothetical protein AAF709_17765 [Pseudomonadota bacterium]
MGWPTKVSWLKSSPFEKLGYLAALCAVLSILVAAVGFVFNELSSRFSEPLTNFYEISPGLGIQFVQDGMPVKIRRDTNQLVLKAKPFVIRKLRPSGHATGKKLRLNASIQTHDRHKNTAKNNTIEDQDGWDWVVLSVSTFAADYRFSSSRLFLNEEVDSFEYRGYPHVHSFWSTFSEDRLNASDTQYIGFEVSSILGQDDEKEYLVPGQLLYLTIMDYSRVDEIGGTSVAVPLRDFEFFEIRISN